MKIIILPIQSPITAHVDVRVVFFSSIIVSVVDSVDRAQALNDTTCVVHN